MLMIWLQGENMLVFNVTFKCKNGMREAFLDAVLSEGIDSAARSEPGNLQYDWYIPAGNRAKDSSGLN